MASDYLTTHQAAELIGYHPDHIRVLIREKKVAAKKWGRDYMIDRKSLLVYVAQQSKLGNKRGAKKKIDSKKKT